MRLHKYKNKRGTCYRGRSRRGRYYTRHGCLLPILFMFLIVGLIIYIL